MKRLFLAALFLGALGAAHGAPQFPWCLAPAPVSTYGYSGAEQALPLGFVTTSTTTTTAHANITTNQSVAVFDCTLQPVLHYLLDPVGSYVTSNPTYSTMVGSILRTVPPTYTVTTPAGSNGWTSVGITSASWSGSQVATVTATGSFPQPPSGGHNSYVSPSIPLSATWGVAVNSFTPLSSGDLRTAMVTAITSIIGGSSTPFSNFPNGIVPTGQSTDFSGSAYPFQPGFSFTDPTVTNVAPNSTSWLRTHGIDITCRDWWLAPGSALGDATPKTLITPYHVIFCNHTYPGSLVGCKYLFLDGSGNKVYSDTVVCDGTVTATQGVISTTTSATPWSSSTTDIRIATFNSAMPSTIHPAKVMPPGWAWKYFDYGTTLGYPTISLLNINGPVISLGFGNSWSYGTSGANAQAGSSGSTTYVGATGPAFNSVAIVGDSGSPAFLYNPSHNELALIGVYHFAGAVNDITDYVQAINLYMWQDYTAGRTPTCYQLGSSTSVGANPWGAGTAPSSITYVPFTDLSSYSNYN